VAADADDHDHDLCIAMFRADIARIACSLNGRPRKTLGYMTPSEKLAELIAHTG
jgi:IS30 family transposase